MLNLKEEEGGGGKEDTMEIRGEIERDREKHRESKLFEITEFVDVIQRARKTADVSIH